MMASRTLFLAALAVVSCVDASWYPMMSQMQRSELELQEAPNNDFDILHFNESTICLRLSASISIQVQYTTTDGQNSTVQVIVPHLRNEDVEGSCGPDAFLHLSWTPESSTEDPTAPPTELEPEDPATALKVQETPWFDLITFADPNSNNLHFEFVQQNDSYFLANITGVINIVDVPEGYPPQSTVIELTVPDQTLFEAPLGVVSLCYGTTVLEAEFSGDLTAVSITMTDVQLLAYYEESFWPYEVKSCKPSGASKPVAFILGTMVALLVNALLW